MAIVRGCCCVYGLPRESTCRLPIPDVLPSLPTHAACTYNFPNGASPWPTRVAGAAFLILGFVAALAYSVFVLGVLVGALANKVYGVGPAKPTPLVKVCSYALAAAIFIFTLIGVVCGSASPGVRAWGCTRRGLARCTPESESGRRERENVDFSSIALLEDG